MWAEKGFLSLKPLSSWTQDLNDRITFLKNWIDNGTPNYFWISGKLACKEDIEWPTAWEVGWLITICLTLLVGCRVLLPSGVYHWDVVELRKEERYRYWQGKWMNIEWKLCSLIIILLCRYPSGMILLTTVLTWTLRVDRRRGVTSMDCSLKARVGISLRIDWRTQSQRSCSRTFRWSTWCPKSIEFYRRKVITCVRCTRLCHVQEHLVRRDTQLTSWCSWNCHRIGMKTSGL